MATVTIGCVVLNLASDLSQVLVLEFATQVDPTPVTAGEDRMYGGGRYRAVRSGGTQRTQQVAAEPVDRASVATLLDWDGRLLCYRDDSGAKMYGTYRSPSVSRHQYDTDAAVSFTFTEVTYSEAV